MKRNLLKLYTKEQLRYIFKTYVDTHKRYEFMKVVKSFVMDNKHYKEGDILYVINFPHSELGVIILNRYMGQHNDFIDIEYLEYKDEELSKLLNRRCWWVYKTYLDYLKPLVKSNFLYKRIEGVEK